MIRIVEDILVKSNVELFMRERGKIVPGSRREGHNVFTITGRNLLAKLFSWQTIDAADIAYTQRRIRWIGVGIGSQLEVSTVTSLAQAIIALQSPNRYLLPVDAPPTFPTDTSVQYTYEFATNEITTGGVPVAITEAGLFADVNPADIAKGIDDSPYTPGATTLDPSVSTNSPVVYKAFEPVTKTVDFTLAVRWTFRF